VEVKMKKSYKICVTFAVMLVAVISFSSTASAAEVSRIQTNKGHIYINAGKDAGFLIGTEVCFYSFSGEEITCGQVKQTNPDYAMVKVDNRLAKQIKAGMKALIGKPTPDRKGQ
jgi:hypothetical protein